MATLIQQPILLHAAGNPPKIISEFVGLTSTDTEELSITRMESPPGWKEPGQTPEFDEYTLVLEGILHVTTKDKAFDVTAGQAVIAPKEKWIRYSTPHDRGVKYIAICCPAFSPHTVHRDPE